MFRSVHHLRGIAALAIVAFHANFPIARVQLNAGVELFFVISGFVIFTATMSHPFSARDYAWRRFLRVFPLWWVALIWFVVFSLYIGRGILPDLWHFLASFMLVPTETAHGSQRPVLNVGWTLVYEVFFYALFGISVWLRRWWISLLVILLLVAFGWQFHPTNFFVGVYTSQIMLCFVAGTLIARFGVGPVALSQWLLPVGIALLFCDPWLIRILGASLIVAGAVALESRWFKSKVFDFLGDASYAIYLFHFSFTYLAERMDVPPHWFVTFVVGTLLGIAAHILIEKPMLNELRKLSVPFVFRAKVWPKRRTPRSG